MISTNEKNEINKLNKKLDLVSVSNNKKNNYYYQENKVKDLGINTPPLMQNLDVVVGWPTATVDIQLERIKCLGFYNPNEDENTQWLNKIWKENYMESEQKVHQRDSMITGISFLSASLGDEDEPEVVWLSENSSSMTMNYDHRKGIATSAFKKIKKEKDTWLGELYTPDSNIQLVKERGKDWIEVSRINHEIGFVPIVPFFNNPDGLFRNGRTELTKSILGYTDSTMRSILSSEVMREYYSRPVRAILGGNPTDFDQLMVHEGRLVWKLESGDIINIATSYDRDGNPIPQSFQEFGAEDPTNVLKMIEFYGRLVAREIGVPPAYMGFDTINPSSADAINASDSKLIQKSLMRIPHYKRSYKKLADYSLRLTGREKGESWSDFEAEFARVDTVTPQAAADRISKLNAVGVFDREFPTWVYREVGLNDVEIQQTKNFVAATNAANVIAQLSQGITDEVL